MIRKIIASAFCPQPLSFRAGRVRPSPEVLGANGERDTGRDRGLYCLVWRRWAGDSASGVAW